MVRPSCAQKNPGTCPDVNVVSACGVPPPASATKMLLTPARSHTNATRRPSGDHCGAEGCLMSIRFSIVNPAWPDEGGADARAEHAAVAAIRTIHKERITGTSTM